MIRWQRPMLSVLIATSPCVFSSVYRFGWRSVMVLATVTVAAFFCEWLFVHARKEPVTSAVFVSAILLGLSLPPTVPVWIAMVAGTVGIVFGKEVFGGFGRNVFNPALVGRCFVYVCFPVAMTGRWARHAVSGWGGFACWSTETFDAVTAATPLGARAAGIMTSHMDLFMGHRAGCLGETAGWAIVIGGVYLLIRRTADYRLMLAPVLGLAFVSCAFWVFGGQGAPDPLWDLLAGGFLFAAVFMTTEPISAARTVPGKWIYGLLVGALTVLMRRLGVFPEGVMFAVLLGNLFNPSIDSAVKAFQQRKTMETE